jgi:Na+/melibiose symporter-like transporter
VLVGATLSILIVAGSINALMYVLSLYFQDPAALDLSSLDAGLATLPAAAVMILITPAITPLASKLGAAMTVAIGFVLSAGAFAWLAFVEASWAYAAFVGPLVLLAVGLGLANGPASSVSTSAVDADQVGAASGISNMARYVGGAVGVAAIAMIYNAVTNNHRGAGESAADALAAGLGGASLAIAIFCASGIAIALLMLRHRLPRARTVDLVSAAAASHHTIPVPQARAQEPVAV